MYPVFQEENIREVIFHVTKRILYASCDNCMVKPLFVSSSNGAVGNMIDYASCD